MQAKTEKREIYKRRHVVDVGGTELAVRNYLEQRDLRCCLDFVTSRMPINSAAEFGCGFGRMTQVPTEYSSNIMGFEREKFLVDDAVGLIPGVKFQQVNDMSETGMPLDLIYQLKRSIEPGYERENTGDYMIFG